METNDTMKSSPSKPILSLPGLGKLKGKQKKTRNNIPIYVFKGIPYAQPPLGKLRFGLPQKLDPWQNTLDCSKYESKECIQPEILRPQYNFLIKGEEDCLYLNVYSPNLCTNDNNTNDVGANLPVIVWFHGGAFCTGSNITSMYGPDYILDYRVVLVGVNYRLGPFGFLSLECDEAPG